MMTIREVSHYLEEIEKIIKKNKKISKEDIEEIQCEIGYMILKEIIIEKEKEKEL